MISRVRTGRSFSAAGLTIAILVALSAVGCKKSEPSPSPETTTAPVTPTVSAPSAPAPPAAPINMGLPFDGMVKASAPLAYFRLESTSGNSEVGNATFQSVDGVTTANDCAPLDVPVNHCASFNAKDGWITTTLQGGIGSAGSIMAWVKLATLPSKEGRIIYVAGESQGGNDFDLQFEPDDKIHFYTAAGANVAYQPDPTTLVNQWHMMIATLDTNTKIKALYWDGKPVAQDAAGGSADKKGPFTIGESSVFRGRYFDGSIDDVAVWNRALSPQDAAALYKPKARGSSR